MTIETVGYESDAIATSIFPVPSQGSLRISDYREETSTKEVINQFIVLREERKLKLVMKVTHSHTHSLTHLLTYSLTHSGRSIRHWDGCSMPCGGCRWLLHANLLQFSCELHCRKYYFYAFIPRLCLRLGHLVLMLEWHIWCRQTHWKFHDDI